MFIVGGPYAPCMRPCCSSDEASPRVVQTSPYLAKCKRLRTDGPTPCLCCPADCIGQYPGHTFVQALIAMDQAERGPQVSVAQRELWQAQGAEPLWRAVLFTGTMVLVVMLLYLYGIRQGWW